MTVLTQNTGRLHVVGRPVFYANPDLVCARI